MRHKKIFILLFLFSELVFSQLDNSFFSLDNNIGYNMSRVKSGYFFEDNMPLSFQLNWQKSNFYKQESLNKYGFSDFGLSFLFHNNYNTNIGNNYGLYAFMEFYLVKPVHKWSLSFRLSQGIAYNTNPYDKKNNNKNLFFGSHLLLPMDINLYFRLPKLVGAWGVEAGLGIFHYSNANIQSPNYGTNIPSISFGINYDFKNNKIINDKKTPVFDNKWKLNTFLRFGINESDYIGSGKYPFYIPGLQFEKHLSYRNKIILGTELFFSYFLKEQIRYESIAVPEFNIDKDTDFKRIGIYAEHEFFYSKLGINLGIGYYIYYPYEFESRFYNRIGVKYYFLKRWIAAYSLKFHSFSRAEAFEFAIYYNVF